MKREYIVIILMLVVVASVTGGVYEFYFKPRLEIYAQDRDRAEQLESQLKQLEQTFMKFAPKDIVKAWKGEVVPWRDAVFSRAPYFNMADFFEIQPVPDAMMLKFYYQEESKRMLDQLRSKIRENPTCTVMNLDRFGAPPAASFDQMDQAAVANGLRLIAFGSSMVDMLLKAKPTEISAVELWPKRVEYDGLLRMYTTGLAFKMTMENLATFIEEELRAPTKRRYFDINAISIQNKHLRVTQAPVLDVRMLLTQAAFVERAAMDRTPGNMPRQGGAMPGAPGMQPGPPGMQAGAPGMPPDGAGRRRAFATAQRPERGERVGASRRDQTKWGRFLKWLKFNFWPF